MSYGTYEARFFAIHETLGIEDQSTTEIIEEIKRLQKAEASLTVELDDACKKYMQWSRLFVEEQQAHETTVQNLAHTSDRLIEVIDKLTKVKNR